MRSTTFKNAILGLNPKDAVYIGLKGIAGHGGYSAGAIQITLSVKQIFVEDEYVKLTNLHTVKTNHYDREEHYSSLSVGVGESKLDTAYIDYEDILYIGVAK